jgi:RNA polymerase sigma-70 factor (ECF subfamily)
MSSRYHRQLGDATAGEAPRPSSTRSDADTATGGADGSYEKVAASFLTEPRRPRLRSISGGADAREAAAAYTDAELFEGIVTGDERMARELYRRLLPAVESTLYRVLGRREDDHEDLVQSTFEQIVATLSRRRYAQACSLTTWASTIAAHTALKSLRYHYRQRSMFDARLGPDEVAEFAPADDDVERSVSARLELDRLRARLSQLPVAQAEAVVLHDLMGHPLTEVATLTGTSVAAAQSRLVRGRKELMVRLSADRERERRSDGRT